MNRSSILFFDVGALVYFVGCASIDYYPLGSAKIMGSAHRGISIQFEIAGKGIAFF